VLTVFEDAATTWGYPASVLTDNGAVYNAGTRKGKTVFESELERLGIVYKHSRPYPPQTCGKIERFHQTLKVFLACQRPARSLRVLQVRSTASSSSTTPCARIALSADARRSRPTSPGTRPAQGLPLGTTHFRVRTDKVDRSGKVTLRYDSKFVHIGVGRRFAGTPIRLYVADCDVRVITFDGELLRHLEIDPSRRYQGRDREIE